MEKRTTETTRRPTAGTPAANRSAQRRGSVTKPVKRQPPWTLIVSATLGVIAVLALVLLVVNQQRSNLTTPAALSSPAAAPVVGASIPNFTVKSQEGKTLTKADVTGKPTLMVFFASWCPHCQAEAPRIKEIAATNPDLNIVMIGVGDRETPADIYGFQQKFNLPFPTYADPTAGDAGKAAAAFGVQSYPTLIAVDRNGIVRGLKEGEVTPAELATFVKNAKA